jgi:predicted nucleic acid-binding protein
LTLDEIEAGTRVFADAPIFVYHFTAASPACHRFLKRCESGELKAVTSAAAIAEVTHRLMMIEAVASELVTPGNVAKKLRAKPGAIKKLRKYDEQARNIALMGVDILALDSGILARASALRAEAGLMVNDSLMASTALSAGLEVIATSDGDFRRVRQLRVAEPGDLGKAAPSRPEIR